MYLRLSAILFAFAAMLCLTPQAVAKDYPSRTINIISPYPPGGTFTMTCLLYTSPSPRDA